MTFRGNELDKVAPRAAHAWSEKERYSSFEFRRIVSELGIVGRVRQKGVAAGQVEIVDADFEYATEHRLALHEQDECAIHPMFYGRLATTLSRKVVYPFPGRRDNSEIPGEA